MTQHTHIYIYIYIYIDYDIYDFLKYIQGERKQQIIKINK